jgi:hypothetical protein
VVAHSRVTHGRVSSAPGVLPLGRRLAVGLRVFFALASGGLALALSLPLAVHDAGIARTYLLSHANGLALPSDFLNYYTAGRTLLDQPAALYMPDLEAALQRTITGQPDLYAQFQNMPQVALLFVPLAWLPYGLAYLLWAALNLALLIASVWLLAPRQSRWPGWASCSVWVVAVLVGYAPAQLALIDGQTAFLALFGFAAWVACLEQRRTQPGASGGAASGALWLLTWAWKPLLLPIPLLALLLSRAIGRAVLLVGLQLLALAVVVAWSGPSVLQRYVALIQQAGTDDASGQTVFGIAQALGEPGTMHSVGAFVAAALICAAIASVWWGGPHPDAAYLLQLASVPLGAVLLAPRAYAYELTLWLASAWLVLRFVGEGCPKQNRWLLPSLLGLVWLAATLITLSSGMGVPWGALAAVGLLAAIVWEYHVWPAHAH